MVRLRPLHACTKNYQYHEKPIPKLRGYAYLFANRRLTGGFTFFQFVLQKLSKSKIYEIYRRMRQSCARIEEKR